MRKVSFADLTLGGTGPVVSPAGPGLVDRGGFRRYDEPGFRTHDESAGPHVHTTPEIFCIFQGTGSVEIDGALVDRFQAGDVVIIDPGEDHHLISDGDVPLVFTWMHLQT